MLGRFGDLLGYGHDRASGRGTGSGSAARDGREQTEAVSIGETRVKIEALAVHHDDEHRFRRDAHLSDDISHDESRASFYLELGLATLRSWSRGGFWEMCIEPNVDHL